MANVFDVAAHILRRQGRMSAMKLQKLIYYCQAWSLVWDGKQLFPEKIQAWVNGPVVYELFKAHRGQFEVTPHSLTTQGSTKNLNQEQKETINAVLRFYGDKSPQWLSDLTHMEAPWKKARRGLAPDMPASPTIPLDSMATYYERLSPPKSRR